MQVVLAMFKSDGDRRSFSLHKDLTVVGRREDCDLRIPLGEISRKHCRFIKDGDTLRVEDLGSSNGTYHNGQRVQEAVVQPGDTIQIGSLAFVVQIDGVPHDDELQPMLATPSGADAEDTGAPVDLEGSAAPAMLDDGEFDPMAVLENADSNVDVDPGALDIDVEEESEENSNVER